MSKRMGCRILSTLDLHPRLRVHRHGSRSEHHGPGKTRKRSELQPGTYRVEVVKNQDSAEVRSSREGTWW